MIYVYLSTAPLVQGPEAQGWIVSASVEEDTTSEVRADVVEELFDALARMGVSKGG